jgi:RNA polymerase sigma-70 factor, ECF subfamily
MTLLAWELITPHERLWGEMTTEEFEDVLKDNSDSSFRMACTLTRGNEQLARDLVQDAFLKIWKKGELERPESFKGWMYRILHNLYMDHLRRRKREVPFLYEGPDSRPLPEVHVEKEEQKKWVHRALLELPKTYREPLMLCDLEGLSYEEIARMVECPVGTVRSRIHRGRRELRAALVRLAPIIAAAATAVGAWFLSRVQQHFSSQIQVEMASKPIPPLAHLKGESRDHSKS